MENLSTAIQSRQPLVVGSVGNHRALKLPIEDADCDLVELRLDTLGAGQDIRQFADNQRASHPLLLTARHPNEGGSNDLSPLQRTEILKAFLPLGTLLDLELRSLPEMSSLWEEARDRDMIRISSWHDFERCPSQNELMETIEAMAEAGATVAKCAFWIDCPADLQRIAGPLENSPLPLALMGMGPLAPSSRLLAARFGSVLNYGYLGEAPTAPGQWPAPLLREAIAISC